MFGSDHAKLAESQNWADQNRANGGVAPRLSRRAVLVGVACAVGPLLVLALLVINSPVMAAHRPKELERGSYRSVRGQRRRRI